MTSGSPRNARSAHESLKLIDFAMAAPFAEAKARPFEVRDFRPLLPATPVKKAAGSNS